MKPNEVRVSDSERLSCSSTKILIDNGHGSDTPGKQAITDLHVEGIIEYLQGNI